MIVPRTVASFNVDVNYKYHTGAIGLYLEMYRNLREACFGFLDDSATLGIRLPFGTNV